MGILYLVSTPIGNLEDITLRATKVLFNSDLILCEDTRRTGRLLKWLKSNQKLESLVDENRPNLLSYTDFNREERMDEVLARLARGQKVSLVSNAGTPLLSDPGYKLVKKVIEISEDFEVRVEAVPGANAILPALQLSGLPPDRFIFLGFLPKSSGKKENLFDLAKKLSPEVKTVICYESIHRLLKTLKFLEDNFGDIRIAVCRELTKMHEEVVRGSIDEVQEYFQHSNLKGEVTLVIRV
ncbi:MAG: 16S rRNA (cytidine(1402)-2'-O)-methyltransferase [Patescibacteria group bacterium]|nr:16S rRNA (cytidine(1402)-2'-O)-methyltransferase [Patescibacteria group bacterium]